MTCNSDQFQIQHIPVGTRDHPVALHRAFGVRPPPPGAAPAAQVADLLTNVNRRAVSIDLLVGAYRGDELLCACLAVESPGRAAMVFPSSDLQPDIKYRATVAALQVVQTMAWSRSIGLLEVLVTPGSPELGRALREAGFRYLTRLRYLKKHLSRGEARGGPPFQRWGHDVREQAAGAGSDLEWVHYIPDRELLFQDALERTYVQSLDCPELTGLRRTADVLAGHRAAGVFDPALWWVAMRSREPVGVILLNRIPSEPALELVYMGVAQVARGTGVADALLGRAVEAAPKVSAKILALAVDERNGPARRMYERWSFLETGARDAWIATPPRA